MNHLLKDLAPISRTAWGQIEEQARQSLGHFLAGRRLVELSGPHGYGHSAVPLGAVGLRAREGTTAISVRQVQPVVELRTSFRMSRSSLEATDRGAPAPELSPVVEAARQAAGAEDHLVFNGLAAAGIAGIGTASPFDPLPLPEDYGQYPALVARAAAQLRSAGIGGPFGLALGPRGYTGVIETTEHGGYPLLEHLRVILEGPVVWAPTVDGALVVSQRGGDFEISAGLDFSIGYSGHDADGVDLYLEESLAVVVKTPEAAIGLAHQDG